MEIQKHQTNQVAKISVNKSTRHLVDAINESRTDLIAANLSTFKDRGNVNYLAVINQVPLEDRLPALVQKYSKQKIAAILTVSLTACFEKMNLRYAMNAEQIVELADMIIETSEEDMLALEDVMLFLQQLVRGQMGKIYDRMDIPTFFEMFEKYRQNRHDDYMNAKEEKDAQFKAFPVNERLSLNDHEQHREALKDYLKNIKEP
jgi:hypothetical protein